MPTLLVKQAVPAHAETPRSRTRALELQGRDLYVREGCYTCHSQMIRPLPRRRRSATATTPRRRSSSTTTRSSGARSAPGPTCTALGGKYPNLWHYPHLMDPRATSPGSNMPSYTWLAERQIDTKLRAQKLALMQKLGVPYTNQEIDGAEAAQRAQAEAVVTDLASQGITVSWDSEMVALISYLQRLGRDVGVKPTGPGEAPVAAGQPQQPQEGAR